MRPLIKPRTESPLAQAWAVAEKMGNIQTNKEEVVFRLTEVEAKKCRYEITDQSTRMAECTVHRDNFSHGIKLHPPHLYKIEDGIVFARDVKKGEWVRWFPNFVENRKRLIDTKE